MFDKFPWQRPPQPLPPAPATGILSTMFQATSQATSRFAWLAVRLAVVLTLSLALLVGTNDAFSQTPELAERVVQRLEEIKQGLGRGDTGAKTQAAQTGLVELLDQLATAAERQEAAEQGQGGGASAGSAAQPKPMPAPAPSLASEEQPKPDKEGPEPPGAPSSDGPPGAWGKLPAKQREAFLQSLREKRFPARYQRILEQYYRGFRGATP